MIEERLDLGRLATFVPNKRLPIYNWLYYKEGFAREIVIRLLRDFQSRGPVLDPFCGVGTTLLACKELGIDSYGFDTLPIAIFAARVKTQNYEDKIKIKKAVKELKNAKFKRPDIGWIPTNIRKFFNPHTLEDVVFFKEKIETVNDKNIRDFLLLGLINVMDKVSYIYKDGCVLKVRKKPTPPLRQFLIRQLMRMLKDIDAIKFRKCNTIADIGDARALPLNDEIIETVITSPPYLNKIEYETIYRIEEFLFFGKLKNPALRSFIGANDEHAYFNDMKKCLAELYRVCKQKARLAIIVGNACFPDRVVESDKIIGEIAEKIGFTLRKIYVLNKRQCTTPSRRRIGVMRESMVLLDKITKE